VVPNVCERERERDGEAGGEENKELLCFSFNDAAAVVVVDTTIAMQWRPPPPPQYVSGPDES